MHIPEFAYTHPAIPLALKNRLLHADVANQINCLSSYGFPAALGMDLRGYQQSFPAYKLPTVDLRGYGNPILVETRLSAYDQGNLLGLDYSDDAHRKIVETQVETGRDHPPYLLWARLQNMHTSGLLRTTYPRISPTQITQHKQIITADESITGFDPAERSLNLVEGLALFRQRSGSFIRKREYLMCGTRVALHTDPSYVPALMVRRGLRIILHRATERNYYESQSIPTALILK